MSRILRKNIRLVQTLYRECAGAHSAKAVELCNSKAVFGFLAQRDALPAGSIARALRMKRPTIYFVLDSLISRGFVTRRKKDKVTYFALANPKVISKLVEEQARNQFEIARRASAALPGLLAEMMPTHSVFEWKGYEIEAFESVDSVYVAVEEGLKGNDLQCCWNPQHGAIGKGRKLAINFTARSNETKATIQEIVVPGEVTDWYIKRITNPNHQVRVLPGSVDLPAEINIVEESIYFASYVEGQELALRIRHAMLNRAMRGIFGVMWASLKSNSAKD